MSPKHPTAEPPIPPAAEAGMDEEFARDRARAADLAAEVLARPMPPSVVDASGRRIPIDDPEFQARREAYRRQIDEYHARLGPVPEDPPGAFERFMREIDDDRRAQGMRTLYDGQY